MDRRRIQQRFAPIKVRYWLAPIQYIWKSQYLWVILFSNKWVILLFSNALRQWNRETIPARVINFTNSLINLYKSSNESSLPVSIILENKLEIKNLVAELSCRPNVLSAKCLVGPKCPVRAKCPVGQRLSAKRPVTTLQTWKSV